MSNNNDSSPEMRPLPKMPTMKQIEDTINYITGSKTITVKNANGKEVRKTTRLPRTKEEQDGFDALGNTIKRSFLALEDLSQYDSSKTVAFAPFIEVINAVNQERKSDMAQLSNLPNFNDYVTKFKNVGNEIIQNQFKIAENENNAYLASRGYTDSSAAIAMRSSLVGEKANALNQHDINANLYGEQLKAANQTNRRNEFDFREQERGGQLQSAEAKHTLNTQQFNQGNAGRQQYLQNQTNLLGLADSVVDRDRRYAIMGANQDAALANQSTQQTNANRINAYSAEVGAISQANQIDQQARANKGLSFGESILGLGMTGLGALGGSYLGGMGQTMGREAASRGRR